MKTKLIKKTLIYTLIGSICLGGVTPALAGHDSIGEVTKTQETDKSESLNTTVYAELGSFFKVSIPKHIILDGTTKSGAYTVSAIGDIAGYETLKITPDKSFALKSNNLNDVTATINQDKTSWKFNEMLEDSNVLGNGTIDASNITAGSWNGNFNFNIFLDGATTSIKVEAKDSEGNDLEASAFDINGSEKEALLNKLVESNLIESINEVDALIEVKSNEFEGLADTTFDVNSIAKEGDKVAILHFDETKQEWEYISTETVNLEGKISADFTSYSPVAFVKVNSDGSYENHKHNYTENLIKQATCTETGTKSYVCICGDSYNEEIIAEGHNIVAGECNKCNYTIAGLYDSNGIMLCTWEQSGIDLSIDYGGSWRYDDYYQTVPTSGYYVLTNKYPTTTKIIIPSNITIEGHLAFANTTNLKNIVFADGVSYIGTYMFLNCNNVVDITIPDSVTHIDSCAFRGCNNLINITIPDNVTILSGSAFYECSNLTTINYTGTKTQWDLIKKDYWDDYCPANATIIYNYTE